jgi:methionine-gamma-lyase
MCGSLKEKGFTTKSVHAGEHPCPVTRSLATPLYQTSTYAFKTPREMQDILERKAQGFVYTRVGNPTQKVFEDKIAALEGGESALSFASGMAAISAAVLSTVKKGDHVIADSILYGSSYDLFAEILPRLGVEVSMIDVSSVDEVEEHIRDNTRLIFYETPANPTMKLIDIKKISQYHPLSMVDNTYLTPYLQNPLLLGADVVIHSATKYLCGHGDTLGGVVVSDSEFIQSTRRILKDFGGALSPFNAWLLIRGVKTLSLRMQRHCENACRVARFLQRHEAVKRVYYPGLKSHPQYQLAKRQMKGCGGMVAFEMHSYDEAEAFMSSLKLCTLAVSLGDVETLVQHPASMTHAVVPKEKREQLGMSDELLRISVGIEDVDDIIEDLRQALERAAG